MLITVKGYFSDHATWDEALAALKRWYEERR